MAEPGGTPRRVTLRDIATSANVSVGAVSQALNGTGALHPETRERIRSIAAELGYAPNQFAAALRRQRSMTIGFVTPAAEHQSPRRSGATYLSQLSALVSAAADHGYSVTVLPDDRAELFTRSHVEAVFLPDARIGDHIVTQAKARGIPVITNQSSDDYHRAVRVDLGYADATRRALTTFVSAGSVRPAVLLGDISTDTLAGEQAYRDWCSEHGVAPLVATGADDVEHLATATAELIRSGADAVWSLAEQGPVVLIALTDSHVVVPRDVQLIALCVDECSANQRLDISRVCVHPAVAPSLAMGRVLELLTDPEAQGSDVSVPWEWHAGASTPVPVRSPKSRL